MRVNLSRGVWIGLVAAAVVFWIDILQLLGLLQPLLALAEPTLVIALLVCNAFLLLLMIYYVVNSGIAMGNLERAVTKKLDDLGSKDRLQRKAKRDILTAVENNRLIRFSNLRPGVGEKKSPE
jgi:hypothetical protein